MSEERKTIGSCFVVMGFGKKTDFETGRVLDLDKSYKYMIKPAVEAAGLSCIRADEIVHSGLIDVPMYEQLFQADVVVADLSTSNKNAFYELGVRHALRPFRTVVIAEDGIKTFPFDVNHVTIRQYHHLGEDIGFEEVMRFRDVLTNAITTILNNQPPAKDSPVYTYLTNLTPPEAAAQVQDAIQTSGNVAANARGIVQQRGATRSITTNKSDETNGGILKSETTHSSNMQLVEEAQRQGNWIEAKTLLSLIRQQMKEEQLKNKKEDGFIPQENPYILQRLALATYKSKFPTEEKALLETHELLTTFNPNIVNDPEILGLWGAVHKRLWELHHQSSYLDEAISAYQRGFFIRNDYYNGINFAFLLNERAMQASDKAEAIADFIQAQRVRREVLDICAKWLMSAPPSENENVPQEVVVDYWKTWYWIKVTMGEAFVGLGDETQAEDVLKEAYLKAPETWMPESTEKQLEILRNLIKDSPLKYLS